MAVNIIKVSSTKQRKDFTSFANKLYQGNPYYVPYLEFDEINNFDKTKNVALDFCDADFFLAYKEGKLVGRVAAIINPKANEYWNSKQVRFGWFDFRDDEEVSKALLDTVTEWGKERGMTSIAGPLGFIDFDPEGMLIDGFDKTATFVGRYNASYYHKHLEKFGYTKEVDSFEYLISLPDELPERLTKIARVVKERMKLHTRKITYKEVRTERYGQKFFNLINESYCDLYGYSLLNEKQIDQFVKGYLSMLDYDMLSFIENEDGELIAAAATMPSFAKALQKTKGKLFPTGWFHMLDALKWHRSDTLEMLLVAVKPEYQNKGVNAMLMTDLFTKLKAKGYKYAESNPELEHNMKVQAQWELFEKTRHKHRRIYAKPIE